MKGRIFPVLLWTLGFENEIKDLSLQVRMIPNVDAGFTCDPA